MKRRPASRREQAGATGYTRLRRRSPWSLTTRLLALKVEDVDLEFRRARVVR
ncbi:hypothetical protein FHU36_004437 [Nonomuraea muscovyensis]|uniref:Uncharacterized protein n=1 Tax=Nonomuraea muscovyensis TaxID=1124761 RepID=A0A7X0C3M9_9ACTN|nr:hypothetical protein [Nonomuraea muscovyensis]MBB6347892.1 hypothetical protein [Nonomuraea muscovyensis]